ncbi:MAG: hypothetical protein Q7S51_10265 [Gallionellaceae bacterium]|nr:hypothetical protein [Gallionellaceae bacterium]
MKLAKQIGQRDFSKARFQHEAAHCAATQEFAGVLQLIWRGGDEVPFGWGATYGMTFIAQIGDELAGLALFDSKLQRKLPDADAIAFADVARKHG